MDFGELEGCTYFRESSYDKDSRLQSNDFIFFVEGPAGCWRKVKESHQQRIYKVDRVKALARKAGFKVEGLFEGFPFQGRKDCDDDLIARLLLEGG